MVKLFYLSVLLKGASANATSKVLASHADVSSFGFFQRNGVREFLKFTSKMLVEKSPPASRSSVKEQTYVVHVYIRADNLAAVLVSDEEYPHRVAHTLLYKVVEEFTEKVPNPMTWQTCPENEAPYGKLAQYLTLYQDPKADGMARIQADLDETKIILYNTISSILERGEKLDDLVAKSEDLSAQSKIFYKTAKKTNQCCQYY